MERQIAAVILGAGKGTRMKSDLPKVLMPVCGKSMIKRIIETLNQTGVQKIITVIAPDGQLVQEEVFPHKTCVQLKQLGTGDAVKAALPCLQNFEGAVLVIFGDTPLISTQTFKKMAQKVFEGFAVVVLGFKPQDPARYGRLKMKDGELVQIVEFKDASESEKQIGFCNSGCMAFDGRYLSQILQAITNNNAAGEYYLTDSVQIARTQGLKCTAIEGNPQEVASANTQEELALLETFLRNK